MASMVACETHRSRRSNVPVARTHGRIVIKEKLALSIDHSPSSSLGQRFGRSKTQNLGGEVWSMGFECA